jgi:hypothetical protein
MRSLSELPADELKVAHDAAETLIDSREYLPTGLLVMMLGRFRDDIREALGMETGDQARRGREVKSLDELTTVELGSLTGAVMILLQDRFTACMDDPELPKDLAALQVALNVQKTDRDEIRASYAS